MSSPPDVRALLAAGEHDEAARLLREAGALREAAEVLARVWRHDEAIETALASDRPDDAYKHAIASLDARLIERTIEALAARARGGEVDSALRAASLAELRGRHLDAATLRRAAGELPEAAALFEKAGELGLAAEIHEATGELRRAGMLYEQRLAETPDDAASALALGRILLGFGRAEHAVRAFQLASKSEAHAQRAQPWLLRALVALGLLEAAAEVLDRLRTEAPALPMDPRAAAEALAALEATPRTDASELLLGRYRVTRALGAGGSGRVLAAQDAFAAREVAVKVLSTSGGVSGRDALSRFAREAQIAAAIEHPNVVRVFEYAPEGPLLVMELMAAGTLEDRLTTNTPLAPAVVLHVARSIARALDVVHRRGVIHRDLKPANVFFGASGEVKVGDFGVAHLIDARATLTGAMMGTLAFMSPEQITGDGQPDASTDLYALGVMSFRMLTGVLPFAGPDFVAQHLGAPVPSACALAPWLDPAFDAAIAHLMAKDKAQRPGTALEALAMLEVLPWREADDAFAHAQRTRDASMAHDATDATRAAHTPHTRAPSMPPAPDAASNGRFVRRERTTHGPHEAWVADDALLGRQVLIVTADTRTLAHLRSLAKAVSPFLQAVLAIDDASGTVVLELPRGAVASHTPVAHTHMHDIAEALDVLDQHGLHHGAITLAHLVLGEGRAVLLLPAAPPADGVRGSVDDDRRVVARLFGAR